MAAACIWGYFFSHCPKFTTIGKDRNKHRFKNWQLCGVWKLTFSDHRAVKLTQKWVSFNNTCINLLVPPSVTREKHPEVLKLLDLLQSIAGPLQRALSWISVETLHLGLFTVVLIFIQSNQVDVENPDQKILTVVNPPLNANGWTCSFKQWHLRRLGCDCLSNSYIQTMKRSGDMLKFNTNGELLWFNQSDTDTNIWAGIQWRGGHINTVLRNPPKLCPMDPIVRLQGR